jgi:MoxR-like ATPase
MTGEVEVRRIASKYLIPTEPPDFVDTGIMALLEMLAFGPNMILKGPKGVGKTVCLEAFAARQGVPFLRYSCTDETSIRDLIGTSHAEPVDGAIKSYFQLGVLPAAVEVANDEGACMLVLEEINTLTAQVQKTLNPLTDYRQEISVPKVGRIFRVNPGCKIWVLGTMNPNYTGTYSLNEDMRSRFQPVPVTFMSREMEQDLLLAQFTKTPLAPEREMVRSLLTLATESRSGVLGYSLSTRDLVSVIKIFERVKTKELMLKLLEARFDEEKHADVRGRIQSMFQVNLNNVKLFG